MVINDSAWTRIENAQDETMRGVTAVSDADMRMEVWGYISERLEIPGRLTVRWELFDYFDGCKPPEMPRAE